MLTNADKLLIIKLAKDIYIARTSRGLIYHAMCKSIDASLNTLFFHGVQVDYEIMEFLSYKPEITFSPTYWFDPKDVKSRLEVFDLLIAQLSESPEYFVSKKFYYRNDESDKMIGERLFQIWKMGLKELEEAQFGIKGVMSGLYIERVWNYSEKQWDDYIEWIKELKNEKAHA